MTLSLGTAYRSFGGEVEASSTPTICRLPDSRRHQLSAIARCRAMFEPPEKGEWTTLNSNLSTRLNLLFSDQALGRRVGYCWSRRASVPRLIFNAKTLKLCSKIEFATQAQQTAPSRYAVECSQ